MVAGEFETSVLPVSRKLLRFATQLLKNEEEARDVVQDVFLKLWQKREELTGVENIEAFAVRMARNRCLDVLRASRKLEAKEDFLKPLAADSGDIHSQIEMSETAWRIKSLIGTLPDIQKKVMQLRDIEQFSYDEIGDITGLNANAIRVNLSRARKKVRDELLKSEENEIRRDKKIIGTVF